MADGVRCAADYHTTGGCYVGLASLRQNANAWEPFDATFAPSESVVTVYINQENAAASVVNGLAMLQRTPRCPRPILCSSCSLSGGIPVCVSARACAPICLSACMCACHFRACKRVIFI